MDGVTDEEGLCHSQGSVDPSPSDEKLSTVLSGSEEETFDRRVESDGLHWHPDPGSHPTLTPSTPSFGESGRDLERTRGVDR